MRASGDAFEAENSPVLDHSRWRRSIPINGPRSVFQLAQFQDLAPQLLKNSMRFRMPSLDTAARSRKIRRNCSPTENLRCGTRMMPACSLPERIQSVCRR